MDLNRFKVNIKKKKIKLRWNSINIKWNSICRGLVIEKCELNKNYSILF